MADLQRNKDIVADFTDILINQGDARRAADTHIGDRYIQHEWTVESGKEAFVASLGAWAEKAPHQSIEIHHSVAEDDRVVIYFHYKPTPDAPGMLGIDMFRLADEKLVEHWTVHMPHPTEENDGPPKNDNGVF